MDRDTIALLSMVVLTAIPVMAISVRIALKPVAEAIVRLREGFSGESRALEARRLERIEAELDGLRAEVERLREVDEFHRSLEASARTSPPGRLPGGGRA